MNDSRKNNPWGLTPRECEVLGELGAQSGGNKAIGRKLGIEAKTVECLLSTARQKMRFYNQRVSREQAAVLYDRWVRECERRAA